MSKVTTTNVIIDVIVVFRTDHRRQSRRRHSSDVVDVIDAHSLAGPQSSGGSAIVDAGAFDVSANSTAATGFGSESNRILLFSTPGSGVRMMMKADDADITAATAAAARTGSATAAAANG